ncbi:MAG: FKBP-type peptidyl-prolyl cis-trans isomerase [Oscillatoriales cyanobacterium SM2_1_8]|nr:FKBP-type peptidyl-prolyl cis-trans isomerase [Oscillatoriales cyanobacterium SM2_1_8]
MIPQVGLGANILKSIFVSLAVVAVALVVMIVAQAWQPIAPAIAAESNTPSLEAFTTTPSGLRYFDVKVGTGAAPTQGQQVKVHYTGWLNDGTTLTNGTKFDSSRDRNREFSFALGVKQVIAGWDEGVAGMKVGGQRILVIPAELGYGARGAGGVIPPNATLVFDVELRGVS